MEWTQIALAVAGLPSGILIWLIFKNIPTAWLLDYGETEITAELVAARRSPIWPDAVLTSVACAMLAVLGQRQYDWSLMLIGYGLSTAVLLLILMADWKTRIIPDPLVLVLIGLAVLIALSETGLSGHRWIDLLWRLLAGIAAALLFVLIGWVGGKLAGQEAMGMGDVKLIAACVWLTGYQQAIALVFLAFVLASLFALPLLIRKYWPRPAHAPDPDGAIAFGPFIVLSTLAVQVLTPEITGLWSSYLGQFQ